MDSAYGNQPRF